MKNVLTGLLIALVVLLACFGGYMANKPAEVQVVEKEVLVPVADSNVSLKIDALEAKLATLDEFENEADEKLQNDTAKALVLGEIQTRDFKKAILAVLEDNSIENKSVEDYKDLTIYSVKIEEVELGDDETAEVLVTLKVSGFEDADEEDSFKGRLGVVFVVEGLDVDELDEAEVAESEITLEKFYD